MATEEINPKKIVRTERSSEEEGKSPKFAMVSSFHPRDRKSILTKQASQKMNCLCSPTTHVGSFRCRLHRSSMNHATRSVGSNLCDLANNS